MSKAIRALFARTLEAGDGDKGETPQSAARMAESEKLDVITAALDGHPSLNANNLDEFTRAYIGAMLWAENDESGEPLDSNYSTEDIAAEFLAEIVADCAAFRAKFSDGFITDAYLGRNAIRQAGHDFWLNRVGHGCGFWETSDWTQESGDAMDAYCKSVGEVYPYVGDDGKIYG